MCPIARPDVVIRAGFEAARRRQKSVNCTKSNAVLVPPKNERLVVRIGEPGAATYGSSNIVSERVPGHTQSGRHREFRPSHDLFLTHPGDGVHVHHF